MQIYLHGKFITKFVQKYVIKIACYDQKMFWDLLINQNVNFQLYILKSHDCPNSPTHCMYGISMMILTCTGLTKHTWQIDHQKRFAECYLTKFCNFILWWSFIELINWLWRRHSIRVLKDLPSNLKVPVLKFWKLNVLLNS